MQIKFKKLHPDAVAPKQGTTGSAGFDLEAISRTYDDEKKQITYRTGIAVEIPKGHVGLVFPRSSIRDRGLLLTNSVGVIDSDYRGEIMATFTTVACPDPEDSVELWYDHGDRIMQLVIVANPDVEYVEVENLTLTKRGAGGYGSTGR